jgi:manganese/zinc/iron transport system permease protein
MTELLANIDVRAVLVALVTNIACALAGVFLVLRRHSLMGDALSHAVLPGLVLAFLFTGSLGAGPMLLGAAVAGMATALLTQLVASSGRVSNDAALGVVFTALFALGVLLVKRFLGKIHFDIACVYEGSLLNAALDTVSFGGVELPRTFWQGLLVLAIVAGCLTLFWKELGISAFDPVLATTMGLSANKMHYLLMLLVSFTAVVSFQAVGSILVVAMLVAPTATAHLLTDRLAPLVAWAMLLAIAATLVGYAAAVRFDVSPAGAMAVASGGLFTLAAFFGPQHGFVSRVVGNLRVGRRIRRDDLLASAYRREEAGVVVPISASAAVAEIGGGVLAWWAYFDLLRKGLATRSAGGFVLTEPGRTEGAKLVRAHRLWESYLVEQMGIAEDHVHAAAHQVEHFLDADLRERLAAERPAGEKDPHGRVIP